MVRLPDEFAEGAVFILRSDCSTVVEHPVYVAVAIVFGECRLIGAPIKAADEQATHATSALQAATQIQSPRERSHRIAVGIQNGDKVPAIIHEPLVRQYGRTLF